MVLLGARLATATLTWAASTTTRLTSVQVLRRISPLAFTVVASLAPSSTTYTDSALLTATIYDYVIRSLATNFSADSPVTSATTPGVCL